MRWQWWPWTIALAVAAILSGLCWWLGWLPWWGALIAFPVITMLELAAVILVGLLSWMASGSH